MNFCPQCGNLLLPAEIDGHTRSRCPMASCGFVHWDNPTPVVAAIVQLGETVVLARKHGWPEKMFALVAGFLEQGETPEAGMLREVREELQVEGTIEELVGVYPFERMNQLLLVFHVRVEAEPVAGEELSAIKRVPIERLRPWSMGTGPAVRAWLEQRGFSPEDV